MPYQTQLTNQQLLQQLPLLANLPEQVVAEVGQLFISRKFAPHSFVYTPEEAYEKIYLLIEGGVFLYQLSDIKRITLAVLDPGDIFGDIHSMSSKLAEHSDNYAETRTASLIGSAYKNDVFSLIRRHPIVGLRIIDQLGQRLHEAEVTVHNLGLYGVGERVMSILVRHCQRHGRISKDECIAEKEFTHEELSALVGSSREAVTRALSELKRQGAVSYQQHEYHMHLHKERLPQ